MAYSWDLDVSKLKRVTSLDYEIVVQKPKKKRSKKEQNYIYKETTEAGKSISEASIIIQKRMDVSRETADRIATLVIFASKKYNLDPRIMLAIIKVESDFEQNAHNKVSCSYKRETDKLKCGDHSIAQINYHVWKDAFIRHKRKPLDFNRLKTDDSYAIFRMAEILDILREENRKDKSWYARYHSNTPKLKSNYKKIVDHEFSKILEINPKALFFSISLL